MDNAPDDLSLIRPDMAYAASYLAARREGFRDTWALGGGSQELEPDRLSEHLVGLNDPAYGARWADSPEDPPVPFAHFWIVTPTELVGRVSVRYGLTAKLRASGGHIGYEIRPSYRGRGLAHRALQFGIAQLRASGIGAYLLTCRDDNAGSIRVIEAAGGILEGAGIHPYDPTKTIRRYWIGSTP